MQSPLEWEHLNDAQRVIAMGREPGSHNVLAACGLLTLGFASVAPFVFDVSWLEANFIAWTAAVVSLIAHIRHEEKGVLAARYWLWLRNYQMQIRRAGPTEASQTIDADSTKLVLEELQRLSLELKLASSLGVLQHSQISADEKFALLREWFYVSDKRLRRDERDAFAELVDDLEILLSRAGLRAQGEL